MDSIVNIISNVGFPIAMCLLVMWYMNNQFTKMVDKLETTVSRLTDVVHDNTQAINLLRNQIGENEE